MHYLILDTLNLLHRARSGFKKGENPVVFNFFRGLRPLVEKFDPDAVVAVLEGHPKHRYALQEDYKGTRVDPAILDESDPKRIELESFWRQAQCTLDLLGHLPVDIVRHPDLECDDVIGIITESVYRDINNEVTIVSTDTDMIQLLIDSARVQVYNPVKKTFVAHDFPGRSYIEWKALVGDGSDNIKGIKGIGPKRASQILSSSEPIETQLGNQANLDVFNKNREMIRFKTDHDITEIDVLSHAPESDGEAIRDEFETLEFRSMTKPESWKKWWKTFALLEEKVKRHTRPI